MTTTTLNEPTVKDAAALELRDGIIDQGSPRPTSDMEEQVQKLPPDWINIVFIGASHVVAAYAIVYMATVQFSWWTVGLGVLWFALCGVSITGGYHRLFSHKAYDAHPILRVFYLFFGAASVQNSALRWSADHRNHHAYTDTPKDPYNIYQGFLWAHIIWVLSKGANKNFSGVQDLASQKLLQLQHRFYFPLAILGGVVLPTALGTLWGDPIGAFLVAGFLRLVIQWHATFSINSVAHTIGNRPYSTANSARDSFWTAILAMGEGYHNFHHRFQLDYRNGIRWYQYDPTKWFVWSLSHIGITSRLKRTPVARIDAAIEKTALENA